MPVTKGATKDATTVAQGTTATTVPDYDDVWEAEDTGASGESSTACTYDGLRPARPTVADDDDATTDDGLRAGNLVHVRFDLENVGELDYPHDPGLILSVDTADISIPDVEQWVSNLDAGEYVQMEWWAVVGPTVYTGTPITFTATVTAHGCEDSDLGCPAPNSATLRVITE